MGKTLDNLGEDIQEFLRLELSGAISSSVFAGKLPQMADQMRLYLADMAAGKEGAKKNLDHLLGTIRVMLAREKEATQNRVINVVSTVVALVLKAYLPQAKA